MFAGVALIAIAFGSKQLLLKFRIAPGPRQLLRRIKFGQNRFMKN